jgi:muramoyltetrapeptide carboxypeptidase
VRIVAPSGPFDPALFEQGLAVLRERFGLVPRARPDVAARAGYLAGDDARRLAEWSEAAGDPEARAIWCARGGYGAMRLLPRIEPARVRHPAKWFVGYSDATALHAALNQASLVTVHGPMVCELGRATEASLDHLEALLFGRVDRARGGGGAPAPGAGLAATGVVRPGVASGTLLGGSLSLLAHLCGTRWLPRLAGAVLFLEDVGEKPYRLDRYLTQLRIAGALDGVRAVCVGHLTGCDEPGQSGAEVVRACVRALGVPAIEGLAAGHEAEHLALPLGAVAHVIAPGPGEPGTPRLVFETGAGA